MPFSALSMLASASNEDIAKKRPNMNPEMQPQKKHMFSGEYMGEQASGFYPMAMPCMTDVIPSPTCSILLVASQAKGVEAPTLSKTTDVACGVLRKCFNEFAQSDTGALNQYQLRSVGSSRS
jgi:hypothetical protein